MTDSPPPMCLPGLHQAVADRISQRITPESRVLDIAAGSGAFTRRLIDMGMVPVANDINPERWSADQVDLMGVDLNTDFAEAFADSGIDAIAAIEVIEHLDNPRWFLRSCREILPAGGFMFVTTPNVTSATARGMFLGSGRTVFFSRTGPCAGDHITLLPWWILEGHAKASGWEVVETSFAGRYENLGFKARLAGMLAGLLGRYELPGEKKFGCTVMTLRGK